MNYAEALAYLDSFINLERGALDRSARAVISLDPVKTVAERLGNPQNGFPSLHVAGTKGKGSTCAFTESMLRAAGFRTGLYTSPHLQDVRERIQLNGESISQPAFARLMTQMQPVLEELRHPPEGQRRPTYFEIMTHMAFLYFAEERVDIAVVEVGLGGRLDATNILSPLACGITNISYDHQAILGETLDLIAREKAGIIKPGVPVVVARHAPEMREAVDAIADVARERNAPMLAEDKLETTKASEGRVDCALWLDAARTFSARLPLRGVHQACNWSVAVRLADLAHARLRGRGIPADVVARGTQAVYWPGRLERFFCGGVEVYLDGAHNAESVAFALRGVPAPELAIVFACAKDKNIESMLKCLAEAETVRDIVFTQVENTRANDAGELLRRWEAISKKPARAVPACDAALRAASGSSACVLALGSLYLVGALRDHLLSVGKRV